MTSLQLKQNSTPFTLRSFYPLQVVLKELCPKVNVLLSCPICAPLLVNRNCVLESLEVQSFLHEAQLTLLMSFEGLSVVG